MEKSTLLKQTFIEAFESTMIGKGFKRKGKIYHRLVNDKVIQKLSYYRYLIGDEFTIEFSIMPLCLGFEHFSLYAGIRLPEEFRGKVKPWVFQSHDEFAAHMPTALRTTEELLFPMFDSQVDYKSFYEAQDYSRIKFSSIRRDLALVLGDYDTVHETKEEYLKYWNGRIEQDKINMGDKFHISHERQERFDRSWSAYVQIVEAIDTGDKKWIAEYVDGLERITLDSYVKFYSTPKKYEKYMATGELPYEVVRI